MSQLLQQADRIANDPNASVRELQDAASWTLMELEKEGEPFPKAHLILAVIGFKLGDYNFAEEHASAVLKYSPDNFYAQHVKVLVAAKKLNLTDMYDVTKIAGSSSSDTVAGLTFLAGLAAQGKIVESQKLFSNELRNLLEIFRRRVNSLNYSCNDYLFEADVLSGFAYDISSDPKARSTFDQLVVEIYQTIGTFDPRSLPCNDENTPDEAYKIYLAAQGHLKRWQAKVTKQEKGCFIATAVYSSYDAPEVLVLRRFRDDVLLKTSLGERFVKAYYALSPGIANRLQKSERASRILRALFLDPIVQILKYMRQGN